MVTRSVVNVLFVGSGLVLAVVLRMKRTMYPKIKSISCWHLINLRFEGGGFATSIAINTNFNSGHTTWLVIFVFNIMCWGKCVCADD